MPPAASHLERVVTQLHELLATSLPAWDVAVDPRLALTNAADFLTLCVGNDQTAVPYESNRVQRESLGRRYLEQFTIRCEIASRTGGEDLAPTRARVFAGLDAVAAALHTSSLLDGACSEVQIGPRLAVYHFAQDGLGTGILFDVTGVVFL